MRETATGNGREGELTRRRFVGTLAASGLTVGLAGCSGDDGTGEEGADVDESADITMTGWAADDTESALLQELIDSYEEENEDVEVSYSPVQDEYEQRLRTQLGAGEAPDVFYVDSSYYHAFASTDVLHEMDTFAEEDGGFEREDFYDPLIEAFDYEGSLYGIPKGFTTLGMFYNEEHLEEAGAEVPESWAGLRETLEAIDESLDVGVPMTIIPEEPRLFFTGLFQNGGQVLSDNGDECVIASEEGVEALEFPVSLVEDGLAGYVADHGGWHGDALAEEITSIGHMGAWGLPFFRDNQPEMDEVIGVAEMPVIDGGDPATMAYTVTYSMAHDVEDPAVAWDLVRYLTSDEGMAAWAEQGLELSAREAHADLEFYEENPRYRTLLDQADESVVWGFGPDSEAILNRVQPQLERAILGEASPRESLESAQEQVNREVLDG
ncbi:MAG: ABC transporter substrate-binding protein [Halalkalicoccus sp.]